MKNVIAYFEGEARTLRKLADDMGAFGRECMIPAVYLPEQTVAIFYDDPRDMPPQPQTDQQGNEDPYPVTEEK